MLYDDIPKTYDEAIASLKTFEQRDAMRDDIDSLYEKKLDGRALPVITLPAG